MRLGTKPLFSISERYNICFFKRVLGKIEIDSGLSMPLLLQRPISNCHPLSPYSLQACVFTSSQVSQQ